MSDATPKAGERWVEQFRGNSWRVYEGDGFLVAECAHRADALCFAHARDHERAVEALRELVAAVIPVLKSGTVKGSLEDIDEAVSKSCAALAPFAAGEGEA